MSGIWLGFRYKTSENGIQARNSRNSVKPHHADRSKGEHMILSSGSNLIWQDSKSVFHKHLW